MLSVYLSLFVMIPMPLVDATHIRKLTHSICMHMTAPYQRIVYAPFKHIDFMFPLYMCLHERKKNNRWSYCFAQYISHWVCFNVVQRLLFFFYRVCVCVLLSSTLSVMVMMVLILLLFVRSFIYFSIYESEYGECV